MNTSRLHASPDWFLERFSTRPILGAVSVVDNTIMDIRNRCNTGTGSHTIRGRRTDADTADANSGKQKIKGVSPLGDVRTMRLTLEYERTTRRCGFSGRKCDRTPKEFAWNASRDDSHSNRPVRISKERRKFVDFLNSSSANKRSPVHPPQPVACTVFF